MDPVTAATVSAVPSAPWAVPRSDGLPNDSQLMAVALAGVDRSVLEVGCSAGHVTRRLVENGCTVTGIEIDPEMAVAAREFATTVIVADLDELLPAELLGGQRFDTIVVGDVLEHLHRPAEVLQSLASLLTPSGYLLSSIPNVTHIDVRLMLLSGLWRYQDGGLLDRTHLRFFDSFGVQELFDQAGFRLVRVERTVKEPFESELAPLFDRDRIPDEVLSYALADPESRTYQFVVVAVAGDGSPDNPTVEVTTSSTDVGPAAPRATALERLLEENEHLRVRVRMIEEDVEQTRWALEHERATHPARRLRALASRIRGSISAFVHR